MSYCIGDVVTLRGMVALVVGVSYSPSHGMLFPVLVLRGNGEYSGMGFTAHPAELGN